MTKPSPFSIRGRRALVVMRDERELPVVRRQLGRLGVTFAEHDPADAPPISGGFDVVVMDADSIPVRTDTASVWRTGAPVIALIGTETPSRLKWLLDLQPASFLIKPLRSAGLYTALVMAFANAQRRIEEATHVEKLEDRIRSRRIVFAAVLQIMRTHDLPEAEAFALIRRTAMRHRTTVEQLSADIAAVGAIPNRSSRTA